MNERRTLREIEIVHIVVGVVDALFRGYKKSVAVLVIPAPGHNTPVLFESIHLRDRRIGRGLGFGRSGSRRRNQPSGPTSFGSKAGGRSIAGVFMSSTCESFVDKVDGVFGKNSSDPTDLLKR